MSDIYKRLKDIDKDINLYYDLSSEDSLMFLERILSLANNSKQPFITFCREELTPKGYGALSVVYEALSEDEGDSWGEFFLGEFKRVFAYVKKAKEPSSVYSCLEDIYIDDTNAYHKKIVSFLVSSLQDEKPLIRFIALDYLGSWIDGENKSKYISALEKMKDLLKDENKTVRIQACEILLDEEYGFSKHEIKLSWSDKIGSTYGIYDFDEEEDNSSQRNILEKDLPTDENKRKIKILVAIYLFLVVVCLAILYSDLIFDEEFDGVLWITFFCTYAFLLPFYLNYILKLVQISWRSKISPITGILFGVGIILIDDYRQQEQIEINGKSIDAIVFRISLPNSGKQKDREENTIFVRYRVGAKEYEANFTQYGSIAFKVGDEVPLSYSVRYPHIYNIALDHAGFDEVEQFKIKMCSEKAEQESIEKAKEEQRIRELKVGQ